ncbi:MULTISPECIES: cell division protein ZapA [Asticcacaulis]|uniref:Cell division protein ZapA n=3 Tax=Asticcacaulis TaxID=76890 RepID=A0A918Q0G5_9CAUL|nr:MULTISPECIES: cell division protein ZapA [Asticcacaulis]MDC7675724.1 cell division protein ZapA [Asticcacaulis machinosus]WAC49593.1 cell division protein ZapA [Asticcacaulis sp. SL142]GGZ29421.1 cell division protein ZapA [Asticcacaulis endophyticus]
MAEVTVRVNNKPYTVGCADGQEGRVQELARLFDEHVEMVVGDVGSIGEVRLFLMAALLMIDEMQDLKVQLEEQQSATARMSAGAHEMERRAAFAITDAAERLEKLVADKA